MLRRKIGLEVVAPQTAFVARPLEVVLGRCAPLRGRIALTLLRSEGEGCYRNRYNTNVTSTISPLTHLVLVLCLGRRMRLTDGGILRPMTSRKMRSMVVSLRGPM